MITGIGSFAGSSFAVRYHTGDGLPYYAGGFAISVVVSNSGALELSHVSTIALCLFGPMFCKQMLF